MPASVRMLRHEWPLFHISLPYCLSSGSQLRSLQLFPRAQSPEDVCEKLREELQAPEQPRVSDQQHIGDGIFRPCEVSGPERG